MTDIDRNVLESAARDAGVEIEATKSHSIAMIKSSVPHTVEGLLSGDPVLLVKLDHGVKPGFYTASFKEDSGNEIGVLTDFSGKIVGEFPARIYVPRKPNASHPHPLTVIGVPGCSVSITHEPGATTVQGHCGKVGFTIIIAD